MRINLSDFDVEEVSGGTVIISDRGIVGFSKLGEMYRLQNCTWKEARDLRDDELYAHQGMTDSQFDNYMKQVYINRGWIATS